MNLRKLLTLSDFLSSGVFIYLLSVAHPHFLLYTMFIISVKIAVETVYLSYEYFALYKKGKIFILRTRSNYFNLDTLLLGALLMTMLYLITKQAHHYDLNNDEGAILGLLTTSKGLFYAKFRSGVKVDQENIMFNDLFYKDLFFRELKSVRLDMKAQDVLLTTLEGKVKKIRLSEEFYEHSKEHLLDALELFKGKVNSGG